MQSKIAQILLSLGQAQLLRKYASLPMIIFNRRYLIPQFPFSPSAFGQRKIDKNSSHQKMQQLNRLTLSLQHHKRYIKPIIQVQKITQACHLYYQLKKNMLFQKGIHLHVSELSSFFQALPEKQKLEYESKALGLNIERSKLFSQFQSNHRIPQLKSHTAYTIFQNQKKFKTFQQASQAYQLISDKQKLFLKRKAIIKKEQEQKRLKKLLSLYKLKPDDYEQISNISRTVDIILIPRLTKILKGFNVNQKKLLNDIRRSQQFKAPEQFRTEIDHQPQKMRQANRHQQNKGQNEEFLMEVEPEYLEYDFQELELLKEIERVQNGLAKDEE